MSLGYVVEVVIDLTTIVGSYDLVVNALALSAYLIGWLNRPADDSFLVRASGLPWMTSSLVGSILVGLV